MSKRVSNRKGAASKNKGRRDSYVPKRRTPLGELFGQHPIIPGLR